MALAPTSIQALTYTLADEVKLLSERPHISGGFADVWIGKHKGRQVTLKAFRSYKTDDLAKVKKVRHLWFRIVINFLICSFNSDFAKKSYFGNVSRIRTCSHSSERPTSRSFRFACFQVGCRMEIL